MAISQLEQAMGTLRLGLAEIRHKESQLDDQISQFETQLRRLPRQVVYGQTTLDLSLNAMGEIEERLEAASTRPPTPTARVKRASSSSGPRPKSKRY